MHSSHTYNSVMTLLLMVYHFDNQSVMDFIGNISFSNCLKTLCVFQIADNLCYSTPPRVNNNNLNIFCVSPNFCAICGHDVILLHVFCLNSCLKICHISYHLYFTLPLLLRAVLSHLSHSFPSHSHYFIQIYKIYIYIYKYSI